MKNTKNCTKIRRKDAFDAAVDGPLDGAVKGANEGKPGDALKDLLRDLPMFKKASEVSVKGPLEVAAEVAL